MNKNLILFLVVALLVVYPPMKVLVERGPVAAFQFFAADSLTYLAVARNSQGKPFASFDGRNPTNGFHPLWQWVLTSVGGLAGGEQETLFLASFGLGIVATALGLGLFAVAVRNLTGAWWAAVFAAVPGYYYLAFSLVEPQFGSAWSFINGMETPLVILLFGWLALLLSDGRFFSAPTLTRGGMGPPRPDGAPSAGPTVGRIALVSLVASLLTLARLDEGFLFLPMLALLALHPAFRGRRVVALGICLAIPTILIGAYLAGNRAATGMLLPISALSKGGFALGENLSGLVQTLWPNEIIRSETGFPWKEIAYRSLQMWVPAVLALLWLAGRLYYQVWGCETPGPEAGCGPVARGRFWEAWLEDPESCVLFLVCGSVLLKGVYNIVNVKLVYQGSWYYPVGILACNLLIARFLVRNGSMAEVARGIRAVLLGSFLLLLANGFCRYKLQTDFNKHLFRFWQNREAITAKLSEVAPGAGLVELDDGIMSFSLGLPVMHGFCFATDPEMLAARGRGEMFRLAHARGFRLLASLDYLRAFPPDVDQKTIDEVCRDGIFREEASKAWKFTLAWRDPVSQVSFIRFEPVPPNP